MDKKAIVEALKELGRYLLFATVSWGIAKLSSLPETEGVLIGVAVLRVLDKYLHEIFKENDSGLKGVAPF